MSGSRTQTTTTIPTGNPTAKRVKARKAQEAAKKKAVEEVAARKVAEEEEQRKQAAAQAAATRCQAAQDACDWATWAQQQEAEVTEWHRLLARAATARSQWGTLPSEMSVSPRRPVVEIRKGKGKARMPAQPVGGDPDDGNEEDRAPCEQCKNKKLPCQMQAGKRSSIILSKQREGGSGERIAVMESQMAQEPADLRALQEAHSRSQQYLHQLLRRQEDDHARLISMDTRMAMMGMGEGPSRRTTERRRLLKWRRIVEESEEGEEEEEEVGKEKEVEKDGEGEEETAPTEARLEEGKERAE
ncbi:hypothetical protein F5879DRAFT_995491 [Lentinula edodes]|nr:hypothetical protein F5879DRAFT_995491 [Lentinula edodes]